MKQTFSKITDIYSRYCNVDPKDFVIPENYYPLPFDKYICISSYASAESMKYDFYRDIIEDLKEDFDMASEIILKDRKHLDFNPKSVTKYQIIEILKKINEKNYKL